ncbi:MAG: dihydropteroate synthase [Planctomycetota bacterium]|jgi:5-methyltetrahydrofolate corrinoid/iron sulfur protein methyltransferase
MEAIGERINGQFLDVKKAIKEKDKKVVQDHAINQKKAGASWLDINTGTAAADPEDAIKWLVETVQEVSDTPIALDSQKLPVIKAGLQVVRRDVPIMLNSVSADPEKLDEWLPLAKEYDAAIVCLTMDKDGISQDVARRLENCTTIVGKALEYEIPLEKIYIDPVVLPISVGQNQPDFIFEVLGQLPQLFGPEIATTCGLSNISNNCAERHLINRIMVTMMVAHGLKSAIVDVYDKDLMDAWITADLIRNRMIYNDSYLESARQ